MNRKPHWSRQPNQISRDSEILRQAGLTFQETTSGFYQLNYSELKSELVEKLMEAEFQGANDHEHVAAKKIWNEYIEELKGA